jgi:DNA-binding IscR family transcriptional regulator
MDNTQFSIAVHLMTGLAANAGHGVSSGVLAASVNTSPSFVRRIVSKLSRACMLVKDAQTITLLDIYRAVEAPKVFAIHGYPVKRDCAVSCGIKGALDEVLDLAQQSMESGLKKVSLSDVLKGMK